MNINKDILNDLLANPERLQNYSLDSLENLANEYPYFIIIKKLISTKKKQIEEKESDYAYNNSIKHNNFNHHVNSNLDKDDDDDEFTELEIEEKELPFENIEEKKEQATILDSTKAISNTLNDEQVSKLQTLAGHSSNYFKDDLSLLPFITSRTIKNLESTNISTYQQLVNISDRDGIDIFSKVFDIVKTNVEALTRKSKILFKNKYQKLLIEHTDFVSYKNRNDLKQIVGIGEFLENKLNKAGIFAFSQLAQLNEKHSEILTALIDYFPGRIERDNWQQQAQKLIQPDLNSFETEKPSFTIKNLEEKLAAHNKINNSTQNSNTTIKENGGSKTFLDWLGTFDQKKQNADNKRMATIDINDEQPRLVKVDEDNLKEIHSFLGNKPEDYEPKAPVFEFLPGFSVKEVAAKSLEEDQNIVSITLAKIYEQQAYFDKAINIYRKLILKYPEKSSFFASQIKVLEEK